MGRSLFWALLPVCSMLTIVAGANAQVRTRIPTCGRDSTGLGRIAGLLIADSAGISLTRGVTVSTPTTTCVGMSGPTGAYRITGLPPGEYEVSIGDLWINYVPRVTVRVLAESTATIDFHMKPENRVQECMAVAECARMLTPPPAATLEKLTEVERIREVAARTGMMLTRRPAALWQTPGTPYIFCIGSTSADNTMSEATVAAVRERFPTVRPITGCERAPVTGRGGGVVKAVGSDEKAMMILVTTITITGDIATVNGGIQGSGWECTFKRNGTAWIPQKCRTTGVS